MLAMKTANISEVKDHLSEFVDSVEAGNEILICRRNVPVARLIPIEKKVLNRTQLGWSKGRGRIHDDLQGPFIPEKDWHMLGNAEE